MAEQATGLVPRSIGLVAVASVALALLACVPQHRKDLTEVGGAADVVAEPPVFPESGEVSPELLVDGLVYDFTTADADLDLWVPRATEARCAAEEIVAAHGARLSDLGYEPGRNGAGINDIGLQPEELDSVSELFRGCVDTEQAIASLFIGGGHMSGEEASCMARGLDDAGMAPALIDSWLLGTGFDPIGEDGALAETILEYTDVCLPDTSFTWNGVDLPGDDEVQGVGGDAEDPSAGSSGSTGKITVTTSEN